LCKIFEIALDSQGSFPSFGEAHHPRRHIITQNLIIDKHLIIAYKSDSKKGGRMPLLINRDRVNPKKFLEFEGKELDKPPKWEDLHSCQTFVILVKRYYEEGEIAFSQEELEKLLENDGYEKRFFVVSTWKLFGVSDPRFEGLAREFDLT